MIDDSGPLFKTLGGEGTDCILIHGFGSDSLSWAANVPVLLPIARIHAVDLPAHGECKSIFVEKSLTANADIFVDGMRKAGASSAHFVGHSLGGAFALAVAARHPEAVKSLALIAPVGLGHGVDGQFLQSLVNVQSVEECLRLLQQLFVRRQLANKMLAKRLLDHLNRTGIRDALSKLAEIVKGWENDDMPALLPDIPGNIPKLVIWGSSDGINKASEERIRTIGATRILVRDAGHLPHIEQVNVVNTAIVALLKSEGSRYCPVKEG
jgi:pyruvate dehydrogenase E2 component (dihydrolipoamide acetyltransferase)